MKKLSILSALVLLLVLSGCVGKYRIVVSKGQEHVVKCPTRANAGQLVKVETVSVTDADLYFWLNGEELKPTREGYYEFTMPEGDVDIKVVIISNGLA